MFNCGKVWQKLIRKKTVEKDLITTPLKRCLGLLNVTLLGIGHMAGAGIYVLTGNVARSIAGPAVTLSYILASIAAFLSALCYSEFGALLPKAGSSYSYVYVVMGELPAFLVGWNMYMENILSFSLVAKATSGVVDSMTNFTISTFILQNIGSFNLHGMSEYPDILATILMFIVALFVIMGVKITGNINSLLTFFNLGILTIIAAVGFYFADFSNWKNSSNGGYFPYGVSGVFEGVTKCFVAYLGFEGIAMAAEETINPSRNIPLATLLALFVVTVFYFLASASLTLIVPYNEISDLAPFSKAFIRYKSPWATHLVSVGSFAGLFASLIAALYNTSRLIYAFSHDGFVFKFLSKVNITTRTPINSVIVNTILGALIALFLNVNTIVGLLSSGILCSFSLIAMSLILLRYLPVDECPFPLKSETVPIGSEIDLSSKNLINNMQNIEDIGKRRKCFDYIALLKYIPVKNVPLVSTISIAFFLCMAVMVVKTAPMTSWWAIVLFILFIILLIFAFLLLCTLEANNSFNTFQVPLFPLVPVLSFCLNIFFMFSLSSWTWLQLLIWVFIGLIIYFGYGMNNSLENNTLLNDVPLTNYTEER